MNLTNQMNENLPNIIKNPFLKNKIKAIRIIYSSNIFDENNWKARGVIEFQNGNTTGEQHFEGKTFDNVVLQIKAVLNKLNNEK